MSFSLSNFEARIPADIVQKGINYFAQGVVTNLQQESETWRADVEGTHPYRVSINIHNGEVTDWNCTCPYDHGPVCKHVVAVMYTMLEEKLKEVIAPKTLQNKKG